MLVSNPIQRSSLFRHKDNSFVVLFRRELTSVYPQYPGRIEKWYPEMVGIPSLRSFYMSKTGMMIPNFAINQDVDEELRQDCQSYIDQIYSDYRQLTSVNLNNPEEILTELLKGRTNFELLQPGFTQLRIEIMNIINRYGYTAKYIGVFTDPQMHQLIEHPINPAANLFEASRLAYNGTLSEIQEYLDRIGVIHFNAKFVFKLTSEDRIFWLTRFYGPFSRSLDYTAYYNYYVQLCLTIDSVDMVNRLAVSDNITEYKNEITFIIQSMDATRGFEQIFLTFGVSDGTRFMEDPVQYLPFYGKNDSNLNIGSVRGIHPGMLSEFLEQYTEKSLVTVFGNAPGRTYREFVQNLSARIAEVDVYVIPSRDVSSICINDKSPIDLEELNRSNDLIIGRGNLLRGTYCYPIDEIITTFEMTKDQDGYYTFNDPFGQEPWSIENLTRIVAILNQLQNSELDRFKRYLELAKEYKNSNLQSLRLLRRWVNESKENWQIMYDLWLSYFYAGMYIRQWKGPGYPYPYGKGETGTEAPTGSQNETDIIEKFSSSAFPFLEKLRSLPPDLQSVIWKLNIYSLIEGNIVPVPNRYIGTRYEEVIAGKFCIRMASSPWVYTGYYYMKQILDQTPPDFSSEQEVDFIS